MTIHVHRGPSRRPLLLPLVVASLVAGLSLTAQSRPWFDDATEATGLAFVHDNGAAGEFHLPEIMGAGVALADIDNDGDLDVILVQSGPVGGAEERRSEGTEDGRTEERATLMHHEALPRTTRAASATIVDAGRCERRMLGGTASS